MNRILVSAAALLFAACSGPAAAPASTPALASDAAASSLAAVHAAHEVYVNAINSNNVDQVLAILTDDIVYQAPHEPEIVGKDAVRAWIEELLRRLLDQMGKRPRSSSLSRATGPSNATPTRQSTRPKAAAVPSKTRARGSTSITWTMTAPGASPATAGAAICRSLRRNKP